jgi:GDP-4-dehydro-6-deoxy-D-mannose reductase
MGKIKILVTGSTGFIGSYLCKRLIKNNELHFAISSDFGDIADEETWNKIPRMNIVIHLASLTSVSESWNNTYQFIKTNCLSTTLALEYCKRNNAKLIFLSSYLYGTPISLPISENFKIEPTNPYAVTKMISEEICKFYHDSFNLNIIILRPFNVYGPNQGSNFLIPTIANQILNQEKIVVKDLYPKRDYIYIDDLIDAIIASLQIVTNEFLVINIGTGKSYSVSDIIQIIQNCLGTNKEIESMMERRKGEIMDTVADISKANYFLKWHPKWTIEDGINKIISEMNQ